MKNNMKSFSFCLVVIGLTLTGCGSSDFSGANEFSTGTGSKSALTSQSSATKSSLSPSQLSGSEPIEGAPGVSTSEQELGSPSQPGSDQGKNTTTTEGVQPPALVCPVKPAKGWDTCENEKKIRTGINKCLALWGAGSPFNASSPYRNLGVSVNVLGFGSTIEDTAHTAAPELVVIPASVNVLTITKYRLLNPNGWYCMIADVGVGAAIGVDLHKSAHLADSRVDVRILSAGNNGPAAVDVHVLSIVKVRRVD